jgi:hypothetical protein
MKRLTIDSNLWEHITHPHVFQQPPEKHQQLVAVHNALKAGSVTGFISQSVMTLEGLRKTDRRGFMTTQTMRARILETGDPEFRPIVYAPDQGARPELKPVLTDRLKDAIELGIRVIEIPAYTEMILSRDLFAALPKNYFDIFGPVAFEIEKRGVGRAILQNLGREFAMRAGGNYVYAVGALPPVQGLTSDDNARIIKAVAEAADGDAVAAHIAIGNDYFVTHDRGVGAKISILNEENREWLKVRYNVRFLNLSQLSALLSR